MAWLAESAECSLAIPFVKREKKAQPFLVSYITVLANPWDQVQVNRTRRLYSCYSIYSVTYITATTADSFFSFRERT